MAVRIRLARRGRKKQAIYDVVVADARSPRDGRFIEKIGSYNPNSDPALIKIDEERAFKWVMDGAQPSDTVRAMLSYRGIMLKKHLQVGVMKGALTQEQADAKYEEWKQNKDSQIQGKVDSLTAKQEADKKARLEAETKIKEARAEALQKKNIVEEEAEDAEEGAEVTEEADTAVENAVAEAPEVSSKEETPEATAKEETPEATPKEETPEAAAKEETPAEEESSEAKEDTKEA